MPLQIELCDMVIADQSTERETFESEYFVITSEAQDFIASNACNSSNIENKAQVTQPVSQLLPTVRGNYDKWCNFTTHLFHSSIFKQCQKFRNFIT